MPYELKGTETPEELKAAIAQLNESEGALKQESIKHRLEAKNFKDKVAAYEKVLTHPETGQVLTPDQVGEIVNWSPDDEGGADTASGRGDSDEVARLRQQFDQDAKRREDAFNKRIGELEGKAKAAEEKAAKQARDMAINDVLSSAGITGDDAVAAHRLVDFELQQAEDGSYGFNRKDKVGEMFVKLSPEALGDIPGIKKLMPKVGASGTGSGTPRPAGPLTGGVDWERFKTDSAYRSDPKIRQAATEESRRLSGQ